MIPYILHVALLISVCLLFYKIFLQKETFYHLNRVVLLICLGLSFALPLISIPQNWTLRGSAEEPNVTAPTTVTPTVSQQITAQVQKQVQQAAVKKQHHVKTQAAPIVKAQQP